MDKPISDVVLHAPLPAMVILLQDLSSSYSSEINELAPFARWLDFPRTTYCWLSEIGGQRIDRQYGDWMHIWNQLTLTSKQQMGY